MLARYRSSKYIKESLFCRLGNFLLLSCWLLEKRSGLELELLRHVCLQVGHPLVVAGEEGTVLLCVVWQGEEGVSSVAFLIGLEVLGHVVAHKTIQQAQLEVVLLVKLLALHSLRVCVVIVFVAFLGQSAQKLLLTQESEFGQDSLFKVDTEALNGTCNLHQSFGLDGPGAG